MFLVCLGLLARDAGVLIQNQEVSMSTTQIESVTQIANELVAHCKSPCEDMLEHDAKLWDKHFVEGWTSIEGDGRVYTGREEVGAKYKKWESEVTCHSCEVTGPFVGPSGFSVIFDLDMEPKDGSWPRMKMQEIAEYTVENGKIVKEEFRYPAGACEESC